MFDFFDALNERIEFRYGRIDSSPEASRSLPLHQSILRWGYFFAMKYTLWNFATIPSSFSFRAADEKELIRVEFWAQGKYKWNKLFLQLVLTSLFPRIEI